MAGKTAILTLKILGDASGASKALDDAAGSAGKFEAGIGKAAGPAAAGLAALGAAGLHAANAAAEDAAAADQLALALRNSAGASDASIKNTEAWISQTSKAAAVADDELRPALGTLVRATGDVGESQDALSTALDVSAATGKDVGTVSDALAKAYGGQTTSLKKLVPGMDDAILASGDMDAIMAELARTTGGAAATAAESTAGKMEGMKIQMAEAEEAIGGALLPAMSGLADILATVATWVQENSTLFLVIGGVLAGVAVAILAVNAAFKVYQATTRVISAATKVWTAIQWLWNAAMSANPITLIIIGIIALIAAIVWIATKTTWFQDIWETVWGAIQTAAAAVWDWIVGAAEAAIAGVVSAWESIKAAVQAVWDWIVDAVKAALTFVVAMITAYINIYITIWDTIKAAVAAVWDWIVNAIRAALDWAKGYLQNVISGMIVIWESIKSAVGAVWDWLKETATRVLQNILDPINNIKAAFDRVVDSIKSVIEWIKNIKVPAAVQSAIDAIGGMFSMPAPPTAGTMPASGVSAFAAPTLSAGATSSRRRQGAPTIVVQGALDPVAVARQIRTILRADDRRRSGVRIVGVSA